MYVGRSLGRARRPARPARSRRSAPAASRRPIACAPSMSVSSRSPTISGRSPPTRRTVSSNSGRSGLPATTGVDAGEAAARLAPARRGRAPGRRASGSSGRCCSRPRAGRRGPARRRAHDRRASARRGRSRVTTATGVVLGIVDRLEARLAQRDSPARPPPSRSTRGARRRARSTSSRAAAWAEVTTSVRAGLDAQLAQVLGHLRRACGRRCW